jgi:hypothetical protein
VENNSEYKLKISSIAITGFHSLEITGIELRPKLDIKQFYQANPVERDWMTLKTHLIIKGINWRMLFWHEKMYAEHIYIIETDLYVFHDKKMPDAPYKYQPLHSYLLRHASFSMTFPIVQIVKARIEYEENPDKGLPVKIVFGKLYGTLCHLSSDPAYILQEPEVILEGKGMIMDSIEATMRYKFSTQNKKDRFTFEGHTGPFSTTLFNKCITPVISAEIKSGHVERVNLFFHANDSIAIGTLNLDYDHLKVTIFSKRGRKSLVKTFLSHVLLSKDDRKRNGEEQDAGIINASRDSGKSVFNYWWLAIKSGLTSSIVKISIPEKNKKKEKTEKHKRHHRDRLLQ